MTYYSVVTGWLMLLTLCVAYTLLVIKSLVRYVVELRECSMQMGKAIIRWEIEQRRRLEGLNDGDVCDCADR